MPVLHALLHICSPPHASVKSLMRDCTRLSVGVRCRGESGGWERQCRGAVSGLAADDARLGARVVPRPARPQPGAGEASPAAPCPLSSPAACPLLPGAGPSPCACDLLSVPAAADAWQRAVQAVKDYTVSHESAFFLHHELDMVEASDMHSL